MRESNKIICLLTIIIMFFQSNIYSQGLNSEQIHKKFNNAVVEIITIGFDGKPLAQGSGVIINDSGYVVTNYHNFENAEGILIKHFDKIYQGNEILGADIIRDILIIKLKGDHFPSIKCADFNKIKVGQKIYTIGSPQGLENTISEGIISRIGYTPQLNRNLIQITAPITHGSSGGAVINEKGELIGISSYGLNEGNLNFAIPINEIENINIIPIKDRKSLQLINLYYRAINAFDAQFYDKSIYYLKKCIHIDSSHISFYYNIGINYEKSNNLDSSIIFFKLAIKKNSKYALAFCELGYIYHIIGEDEAAEKNYLKSIKLNPKIPNAYNNLGAFYLNKNDYKKSVFYSKKALEYNRYNEGTYSNLIVAYRREKEYNLSIEYAKKGLEKFPNSEWLYYSLGKVYKEMKDYYRAVESFSHAIKIDENCFKAVVGLGMTYSLLHDYENAIQCYKKVVYYYMSKTKPLINQNSDDEIGLNTADIVLTYFGLGNAYLQKENLTEANRFFEEGLKISPNVIDDFSFLLYSTSFEYYNKKQYEQAEKFLNKFLDHKSTNPSANNLMGILLTLKGKYEEAIKYYIVAIKYDSKNSGIYFNIAKTYLKVGKEVRR